MTSTIHSQRQEGGRNRIVFSHEHEGRTWGPCVEDRPIEEDAEAFVAARQAALEAELATPDAYQQFQYALDTYVGPGTYDAVRQALADFGFAAVRLGDSELRVVPPGEVDPQPLPTDLDAALRTRLDAARGAGTYDAVRAVLKGAGFDVATMVRSDEVPL